MSENSNILTRRVCPGEEHVTKENISLETCQTYVAVVKPYMIPGLEEKAARCGLEIPDMKFMLSFQRAKGVELEVGPYRLVFHVSFGTFDDFMGIMSMPVNIAGEVCTEAALKALAKGLLLEYVLCDEYTAVMILVAYCRSIGREFYESDEDFEEWLENEELTEDMLRDMGIKHLRLKMIYNESGVKTEYAYKTAYGETGAFHGRVITSDMDSEEAFLVARTNYAVYDGLYLTVFGKGVDESCFEGYTDFIFEHTNIGL